MSRIRTSEKPWGLLVAVALQVGKALRVSLENFYPVELEDDWRYRSLKNDSLGAL